MIQMKEALEWYEAFSYTYRMPVEKVVASVAIRIGYHPAGYGMYSPKIIDEEGMLFATWARHESCD